MKTISAIVLFTILLLGCSANNENQSESKGNGTNITKSEISESDKILQSAFNNKQSSIQVQGSGTVIRLLSDDLSGSKHQLFILKLAIDQTLLISHNIDLAARIDILQINDIVEFNGVYEWDEEGGVVHWTHDDPNGSHVNGWLKHNGITYH